jgi:putative ATP-binding cassette transporter
MLSATTLYGALDSATVFLFLLLSAGVAFGLGPVLGERTPLVVMGLLFMQGPLDTIVFELQSVSLGATVLEQTRAMTFATEPDAASAPAREVGLRGATRAYVGEDGKDFELGPVDVTLRPGEVLFVVGGNGSGKSTLAKVLTGLYVAQEGAVLVDGAEVAPGEGAPVLRGSFAAVFAEGFVPRRMWGVPPEEAARVGTPLLEELELSDKVQIADGAFTEVGVSSGQRKRLALVAAMVRGRSLFVFDEWAAEQDPKWRAWFYERFLPRLRDAGRAVLVVTHDDAYFHLADRVLHLRDGRVLDGGAS